MPKKNCNKLARIIIQIPNFLIGFGILLVAYWVCWLFGHLPLFDQLYDHSYLNNGRVCCANYMDRYEEDLGPCIVFGKHHEYVIPQYSWILAFYGFLIIGPLAGILYIGVTIWEWAKRSCK